MSDARKILLLGASGQVGRELLRSLAPLGEVVATTRSGRLFDEQPCQVLDVTDLEALDALVRRVTPDVVVNAAAYTAVDRAEDETELAFLANALAPARLAQICADRGATLVHYSTDYVFDGAGQRSYREDDATAPLGVYGASKLAGEDAIRDSGARYLILRTAWVYALHGQNFLRTMLRLGAERDELRVVADQIGSPTPAWLIADVTARAIEADAIDRHTWHLVTAGEVSWHGFADAIMQAAVEVGRLSRAPTVTPITTAEFPTRARRPAYSVLDTSRLQDALGLALPDWQSALRQTLVQG